MNALAEVGLRCEAPPRRSRCSDFGASPTAQLSADRTHRLGRIASTAQVRTDRAPHSSLQCR